MDISRDVHAFVRIFDDPYDVHRSYQLSGRLQGNDSFKLIGHIRDADVALDLGKYGHFRKSIAPVIAFLPASRKQQILSRVVYNHLYLRPFEPRVFAFRQNEATGLFGDDPDLPTHDQLLVELGAFKKTIVRTSKKQFHGLYGWDLSASHCSMRYMRCRGTAHATHHAGAPVHEPESLFRDTNTNFLHLDEKKGLTTIVYLSHVTAANGGFRYVEGSHAAPMSTVLKSIHEFMYNDLKLNSCDDVLQFPAEFRAGINYYAWLEPEKRRAIDAFTHTLEGPAGTAISFAGNRLLHGGGIPYVGERTALFVSHIGHVFQRLRHRLHPLRVFQNARA